MTNLDRKPNRRQLACRLGGHARSDRVDSGGSIGQPVVQFGRETALGAAEERSSPASAGRRREDGENFDG